jgi:hypothetical protein
MLSRYFDSGQGEKSFRISRESPRDYGFVAQEMLTRKSSVNSPNDTLIGTSSAAPVSRVVEPAASMPCARSSISSAQCCAVTASRLQSKRLGSEGLACAPRRRLPHHNQPCCSVGRGRLLPSERLSIDRSGSKSAQFGGRRAGIDAFIENEDLWMKIAGQEGIPQHVFILRRKAW